MKRIYCLSLIIVYTITLPQLCIPDDLTRHNSFIKYRQTNFLTFNELQELSQNPNPERKLQIKVQRFLRTPIVNNASFHNGIKPYNPFSTRLNTPVIRLVSWNIEKSINLDNALTAFTSGEKFRKLINNRELNTQSLHVGTIMRQREQLSTADIIVLQEMDIGTKRSGYVDAPQKLAHALNMNYAFAPQYLEIDPVLLGLEKVYFQEGGVDQEATEHFHVNPQKYKGIFGSAFLSRYPIKYVEVIPLIHQPYDWYHGEKQKTSFLESSRRIGSKVVFKNEITREIKIGGRHYFRVDLHIPELPQQTLSIINVHLEIKCMPKGREKQIEEILTYIKDIPHPVILVGDFNSAPTDLSATSLKRTAKRIFTNPTTWFSAGVTLFSPNGLIINSLRGISNVTKNYDNPLAADIPIVAPNILKKLFSRIHEFRFSDGGKFDFRGDLNRSMHGKAGPLSNSNQRDFKGFKKSFMLKRPFSPGIGKFRLDWIFVKSYLTDDPVSDYRYFFAPHFGETLEELNTTLYPPISDHHPNVVDLPLNEPSVPASQ